MTSIFAAMQRSLFTPLALAAIVLGLSACGGGDSAEPSADADVVVGALDSLVFDAPEYTAPAGEVTIAYVNKGAINHTLLVVGEGQQQIGEKLIIAGNGNDEGTYTLAAGTYLLFCDVPGHGNMKSNLVVT